MVKSIKMDEIHFLLGNSCNLNCDFCFWDKRISDTSLEFKRNIVDQIIKTGIRTVTVSGGEPLCSKDLLSVLKYMHQNNLEIILHTNGLKMDRKVVKKLAPLISRVSLTLDGADKEMVYKMRKNRQIFRYTIFLINFLNKLNIPTSIKTLVTKVNKDIVINIGKTLENLPIQYWSLLRFIPIGRGKINKRKYFINPLIFDKICAEVKKNFPSLSIRICKYDNQKRNYCFVTVDGKVYTFKKNVGDFLIGDLKTEELKSVIRKIEHD